jgi:hypothetical protein
MEFGKKYCTKIRKNTSTTQKLIQDKLTVPNCDTYSFTTVSVAICHISLQGESPWFQDEPPWLQGERPWLKSKLPLLQSGFPVLNSEPHGSRVR